MWLAPADCKNKVVSLTMKSVNYVSEYTVDSKDKAPHYKIL